MTLSDWLRDNNVSQTELARAIGVAPSAVTKYVHGARIPRAQIIKRIEAYTRGDVGPAAFYACSSPTSASPKPTRARGATTEHAISALSDGTAAVAIARNVAATAAKDALVIGARLGGGVAGSVVRAARDIRSTKKRARR